MPVRRPLALLPRLPALLLAGVAAAAPGAFTVATCNVENYVTADRVVDGVYRPGYPKPAAERAALVRVVAGINPDLLALEEMGPAPYLAEFQRELRAAGQVFPRAELVDADDADRHVALLAKLPLKAVRLHARVPLAAGGVVKRGVLEAVVATTSGDCTVFVVHLKSRFTERPEDPLAARQRAAEAEAVRDLVLARRPDPAHQLFLVCGDWNDTPRSRPVRALQRRGATEIGRLLPAADRRGETWTHCYKKEDDYSRIDYFLASPALGPAVAGGRAAIWDGAGADEASDHRAVYVRLELTPVRR